VNVRQLIEILKRHHPEAEVVINSAPNWPMQFRLAGVTTPHECLQHDADEDSDSVIAVGPVENEVILVEGPWHRYGTRTAWDVARRT
jgi:hypothetical protein